MIAVGYDPYFARAWAVLFKLLGRIVIHRLLITAYEQHRAADALGIFDKVRRVGQSVQERPCRDHPPPGRNEHQLARFAGSNQRFRFLGLFVGLVSDGEAPRRSWIGQTVPPGVSR